MAASAPCPARRPGASRRRRVQLAAACALLLGGVTTLPAAQAAVVLDGIRLDESTRVGGRSLRLNGAGTSIHFIFKLYVMGLYLPERHSSTAGVLAADGPRRLVIAPLRDVSTEDFCTAIVGLLARQGDAAQRQRLSAQMLRLAQAIGARGQGLRKGDTLTLDWVPGTGTVVELNRQPVSEPLRDPGFYEALLKVWLGDTPADPALKPKLLGEAPEWRAAAN